MGKKGGKKDNDIEVVPFVPMPRTWPGKLSDLDLFSTFAKGVREELAKVHEHEYVTLRIRQVDWEFHDFLITLPKSATVLRLKNEIAAIQHGGSVLGNDVVLYRTKMIPEVEEQCSGDFKKMESKSNSLKDLKAETFDSKYEICHELDQTLSHCFPEISSFEMLKEEEMVEESGEESEDPKDRPTSSGRASTKGRKRASSKSSRATSAKSRGTTASRGTSASTTRTGQIVHTLNAAPPLGFRSVHFSHDKPTPKPPVQSRAEFHSRPKSGSKLVKAPKKNIKPEIQGGPSQADWSHAITIYYDVWPYIEKAKVLKDDKGTVPVGLPETIINFDIGSPLLMRNSVSRVRRGQWNPKILDDMKETSIWVMAAKEAEKQKVVRMAHETTRMERRNRAPSFRNLNESYAGRGRLSISSKRPDSFISEELSSVFDAVTLAIMNDVDVANATLAQ